MLNARVEFHLETIWIEDGNDALQEISIKHFTEWIGCEMWMSVTALSEHSLPEHTSTGQSEVV